MLRQVKKIKDEEIIIFFKYTAESRKAYCAFLMCVALHNHTTFKPH